MDAIPVENVLGKIDNEGVSYFFTDYASPSTELDFTNVDKYFDITEEEKEENLQQVIQILENWILLQ